MKVVIFLGKQQLHGIFDNHCTKILNQSLTLEHKGILEEEKTFSETEHIVAQDIKINNFVGNVANASVECQLKFPKIKVRTI